MSEFEKELATLINRNSLENGSNTPDFILAKFLQGCLNAYNLAVQQRDSWGKFPKTEAVVPVGGSVLESPDPNLDAPPRSDAVLLYMIASLLEKQDLITLSRISPDDLRTIASRIEKKDGP